jgi:hypothetical protein
MPSVPGLQDGLGRETGGMIFPGAAGGPEATALGCGSPGKMCLLCWPTSTLPFSGMKRTIKLISFWGPPATSQGSHTLYEWPISDLL